MNLSVECSDERCGSGIQIFYNATMATAVVFRFLCLSGRPREAVFRKLEVWTI